MAESWLTPSDIVEKLSSHVSSGFLPTPSIAGQELRTRPVQIQPSKPSLAWWLGLLVAAGIILLLILWRVGK